MSSVLFDCNSRETYMNSSKTKKYSNMSKLVGVPLQDITCLSTILICLWNPSHNALYICTYWCILWAQHFAIFWCHLTAVTWHTMSKKVLGVTSATLQDGADWNRSFLEARQFFNFCTTSLSSLEKVNVLLDTLAVCSEMAICGSLSNTTAANPLLDLACKSPL